MTNGIEIIHPLAFVGMPAQSKLARIAIIGIGGDVGVIKAIETSSEGSPKEIALEVLLAPKGGAEKY